jgi:CelD/BcsL family acetyltransferase involved in cellulose biosynthesis
VDYEVYRPSALSPADLARWSALQAADRALESPYLSPGWALAVERAQAEATDADRARDVRVVVLREDGEAAGFFAARVDHATAMPAGAPMNDYQGLVARPGLMVDPQALLKALDVSRLDFTHLLCDQPWFAASVRGLATAYRVEAPEGYAAYAQARRAAGSGVLKDIDKRRRKLEREVGAVTLTAHSRSTTAFDQLIAWKRAQYRAGGQTDIFDTPWTLRLLRDLHEGRDPDFGGVLFTLHVGGQLAAAQFDLRGRTTLHAWIIAHDPAFERYSPGLILFGEILRWMDDSPFRILDLGAGDYRFKLQLANAQSQVGHGFIGRPSPASLLRSAQYGVRAAAERLPLGPVSALPGKAMRRMDRLRGLR